MYNVISLYINKSENTHKWLTTAQICFGKIIEFEVLLMTWEKAIFTFPKVKDNDNGKEIKIECILLKKLINSQLMLQQFCALDGYKEIIKFNKVSSKNKINIEMEKKENWEDYLNFGLYLDNYAIFSKD